MIILMILDHAREYFHYDAITLHQHPLDLETTSPFLYLTRAVPQFLGAPTFVMLAGLAVNLFSQKGGVSRPLLSHYLLTRGLCLIGAELTLVSFAWDFSLHFPYVSLQAIWAVGIGLVCLCALVRLRVEALLGLSLAILLGHNLLDAIQVDPATPLLPRISWALLHQPETYALDDSHTFRIAYPLVPWVGIMILGYCAGTLYRKEIDPEMRRRCLISTGLGMILLFILLRSANLYGDASPWQVQNDVPFSIMSFLNVTKSPPSLLYILQTLGLAFFLLGFLERELPRMLRPCSSVILAFGRAPWFSYVSHIVILHSLSLGVYLSGGGSLDELDYKNCVGGLPTGFGFPLWVAYLFWVATVAGLYPLCRWFGNQKLRNRNSWWVTLLGEMMPGRGGWARNLR